MNNSSVENMLNGCDAELNDLQNTVNKLGNTSPVAPYLTKYAIIRACGTIEQAFKTIVADHCSADSKAQVREFLRVRVRESSSNPSWEQICKLLKDFDKAWNEGFKTRVNADADANQIKQSLKSLVDARNDFAHGGNPSTTIGDVKDYFDHASRIVRHLDSVVV